MVNLGVRSIGKTVLSAALTGTQKGILIGGGAGMVACGLIVGVSSMIKKKRTKKAEDAAKKEEPCDCDYREVKDDPEPKAEEVKEENKTEASQEQVQEENKAS